MGALESFSANAGVAVGNRVVDAWLAPGDGADVQRRALAASSSCEICERWKPRAVWIGGAVGLLVGVALVRQWWG